MEANILNHKLVDCNCHHGKTKHRIRYLPIIRDKPEGLHIDDRYYHIPSAFIFSAAQMLLGGGRRLAAIREKAVKQAIWPGLEGSLARGLGCCFAVTTG